MLIRQIIDESKFEKSPGSFEDFASQIHNKDQVEKLGSGVSGMVFSNPADKFSVIKVYANDRGYSEWLKFMLANQDNPYVPRVRRNAQGNFYRAYKHFQPKTGDTPQVNQRIVEIYLEKLERIPYSLTIHFSKTITDLLNSRKLKSFVRMLDLSKTSPVNYFDILDEYDYARLARVVPDKNLAQIFAFISRELSKNHARVIPDLNNNNFMMRPGTNQIVFTDPLASA